MTHRLLFAASLSLAAAACAAEPSPADPATTPTPAALRARLDQLVPPIAERTADAAAASASSLGAIARELGLPALGVSIARRPILLGGGADVGARAAAWLDGVLSDDAFDGSAYHVPTGAVCGDDAACTERLASADLQIRARTVGDDGVELSLTGLDDAAAITVTLSPDLARASIDLAALAPVAGAVLFSDPARALSVEATGFVDVSLPRTGDTTIRTTGHGPVRVVVRPATAPTDDDVTSLEVGQGSRLGLRERGHGPVVIAASLRGVVIHTADGDDTADVDADATVQDGQAAITRLDLAAP